MLTRSQRGGVDAILSAAFPASVRQDVSAVLRILPAPRLSPVQRTVLRCLLARHHDGRVRAAPRPADHRGPQPWVIPFVVALVGEYVLEILTTIRDGLVDLDIPDTAQRTAYGRLLAANSHFLTLVGQRVGELLDCYYRSPSCVPCEPPRPSGTGF